ncbi:MAG: hypothetical protein SNF68_05600 [Rikenellaceae bacterium]
MRYICLLLMVLFCNLSLYSQPQPQSPRGGGGVAMPMRPPIGVSTPSRPPVGVRTNQEITSLIDLYIVVLSQHLDLSTKQSKEFVPLYTQYYNDMSELSKKSGEMIDSTTSEQEIEQKIYDSFDTTDKITELKRVYYPEFRKILSAHQILMMYDVERELLWRMSLEGQKRLEEKMEVE